jgi:hypothetical protein
MTGIRTADALMSLLVCGEQRERSDLGIHQLESQLHQITDGQSAGEPPAEFSAFIRKLNEAEDAFAQESQPRAKNVSF